MKKSQIEHTLPWCDLSRGYLHALHDSPSSEWCNCSLELRYTQMRRLSPLNRPIEISESCQSTGWWSFSGGVCSSAYRSVRRVRLSTHPPSERIAVQVALLLGGMIVYCLVIRIVLETGLAALRESCLIRMISSWACTNCGTTFEHAWSWLVGTENGRHMQDNSDNIGDPNAELVTLKMVR